MSRWCGPSWGRLSARVLGDRDRLAKHVVITTVASEGGAEERELESPRQQSPEASQWQAKLRQAERWEPKMRELKKSCGKDFQQGRRVRALRAVKAELHQFRRDFELQVGDSEEACVRKWRHRFPRDFGCELEGQEANFPDELIMKGRKEAAGLEEGKGVRSEIQKKLRNGRAAAEAQK